MSRNEPTLNQTIQGHAERMAKASLIELFDRDPSRMSRLSIGAAGLHLDLSKQFLDQAVLSVMLEQFENRNTSARMEDLFTGAIVNTTEGRAVLHTGLRDPQTVRDQAVADDIRASLQKVEAFADAVRLQKRLGVTGRSLTQIVHLGIGGSDLGPRLLYDAARYHRDSRFTLRFAANVDPSDINDALFGLDPETTLVIMVSKSFSTQETKLNANVARAWLETSLGKDKAAEHFVAVTANGQGAREFGIAEDAIFGFGDYVGGRFSLWSAVSLSLAIALGPSFMDRFRQGAKVLDEHFRSVSAKDNLVFRKAICDIWNRSYLGFPTRCVVPYAKALSLLPQYLQQLEMESNGKAVTLNEVPVSQETAATVWGTEGTNAQHAYFQHLHQSSTRTPVDFIGVIADRENNPYSTRVLHANMIAQAEALMLGEASPGDAHRRFTGNRPSSMIWLDALDPEPIGALIALHEHKVFLEAVFWNINAFDQFGVELGKKLAKGTLASLEGAIGAHDASTLSHIERLRAVQTSS
jgi:glucose-6-phosphate isomerase